MLQYWVLNAKTKIIEMWVFLEHKNDANTPAVLELWVLEVGPGLGRREKEPATSPD